MRALWSSLREDHLVRNSAFIVLTNAAMAGFGFVFWLLAARLYPADDVGLATTLVTATILLSYASLLGFNSTLVQRLPTSTRGGEEISGAVALVVPFAAVLALGYVLLLPEAVPEFGFVRAHPWHVLAFVLGTATAAASLLTDAVFIAHRKAEVNLLTDGFVQGGLRVLLPLLLVGLGAMGLYDATAGASTVAVLVSIVIMGRRFGYRLSPRVAPIRGQGILRLSASNYVANLVTMVPVLMLPLVVVHAHGAAAGGYYYIAIQVANLLYSVALAMAQSTLAEGSHHGASFSTLARRSGVLQVCVLVPGGLVVAAASSLLLGVFGPGYQQHGRMTLVVFALAAPAVGLNYWTSALLRLVGRQAQLVASNVVYTAVTVGAALLWVDRGLPWVALAWLVGNLVSGAYGLAALLLGSHDVGLRRAVAVPAG